LQVGLAVCEHVSVPEHVRPGQQASPAAPQWTQVRALLQVNGSAHQLASTLAPPPPPVVPRPHC
jgi:hypothetical protein